MKRAMLEDYAVSKIVKNYLNEGKEPRIYYYRDKDGKEIDVMIEEDGTLHPVEIKKTARPASEITKSFRLLDRSSAERGKGAVVCMKRDAGAIDRDNFIIPVWAL